jgi:DNA polymerase
LLNKFSKPRKPTKKNPNFRLLPSEDPVDGPKLYAYNIGDIHTTRDVEGKLPELSGFEKKVWQLDQKINYRGVHIDTDGLKKLEYFVKETEKRLLKRLRLVTGGTIQGEGQVAEIVKWLSANGLDLPDLKADTVTDVLEHPETLSPACREVLYLRSVLASSSVKKIFSIGRRLTKDGRLHDLFAYCGAERTGRFAGRGPQPQNLPHPLPLEKVEQILKIANYDDLVKIYDDPLSAVSGCLRALFSAKPGHDLICADYSAIEAVGLAELAGETWRQKLFRTHGKIYEASAASISGIPLQEFLDHKERTGEHHPLREKIGKVAELASGYGGWINAWKHFGADEFFKNDREIRDAILKWRAENLNIVEFWGGQVRKDPYRWAFTREYFGLEGAAVKAILNSGTTYCCRSISYCVHDDVLYCKPPSGRNLCYHSPRLLPYVDPYSKENIYQITYMGFNRDPKVGPRGWMRITTRGGKLAENVTQAACRDLLVYGMLNVEAAGYPIVLHVHDEIVSEIPQGFGSLEEFCRLMSKIPEWAKNWPVRASGWRGKRYRKD